MSALGIYALVVSGIVLLLILALFFLVKAFRKKGTNAEILGLEGRITDAKRKYKALESAYIAIVNKRETMENALDKKLDTDSGRGMLNDLESRRSG